MIFQTSFEDIESLIQNINPVTYAKSRNFADGAVTKLSPYISRGVISTKKIYESVKSSGITFEAAEKLIQELAWRDYWQQVWVHRNEEIFGDLKRPQSPVLHHEIPKAIFEGTTGIQAVDRAIEELYQTGYMHNHMRMYIASISCNVAQCHWLQPAKWLYANLLDGDLASNMLSWQWVAGSNANKKYYANQENINKYFYTHQQGTFLDKAYEEFENMQVPEILQEKSKLEVILNLKSIKSAEGIRNEETLVYNYYNLDANWYSDEDFQRIFLLEPSIFERFPISEKCLKFTLELSKNIPDLKLFVGEFDELSKLINSEKITFKEHPLNKNYLGKEDPRDWICSVQGDFPSFFAFWKKCKKEIRW